MKLKFGIAVKIISLVVILELIANALLLVSIGTLDDNGNVIDQLYEQNLQGTRYSLEMRLYMANCASALQNAVINAGSRSAVEKYHGQFSENVKNALVAGEKYKSTIFDENEEKMYESCVSMIKRYDATAGRMFVLLEQAKGSEADAIAKAELIPLRNNELLPILTELTEFNSKAAESKYDAIILENASSKKWIEIALIIGDLLSLCFAIIITLGITKPVRRVVNILTESSRQMECSSSQLSESSQEIANGAQEQASGIEETTASMEELSSMVQQNLANAREASVLSEKAANESQSGSEKMSNMLAAMGEITKSTEEIHSVIDVIEDIAFQTNMLALNASVEAARAGEAGMGFAVVADEVKNLANRSAESAKETAAMIKQTLKNVESGRVISQELSEIFKDMLSNSKKVMEMNREVETASGQQEEGISQVSKAMIQFDTVIQGNASSAEETASAAEEMHSQVATLEEMVNDLFVIVSGHEQDISRETPHIAVSLKKAEMPRDASPEKRKLTHPSPKVISSHAETHAISFEDDEEYTEK